MLEELRKVVDDAGLNHNSLVRIFDLLPNNLNTLPNDIIDSLERIVPQIAALLYREFDEGTNLGWRVCELLAFLGPRSRQAIPALFDHVEIEPRMEINAIAIGKIGGPGTVSRLIRWTYWQGNAHDRKRTDAVCCAIRLLGEPAVEELLELAESADAEPHDRASAILNLFDNTECPRERLFPLFARELERNYFDQCVGTLVWKLEDLAREFPEPVVAAIAPLLRPDREKYYHADVITQCFKTLSMVGLPAIPLLREIGEREIHRERAMNTLTLIDSMSPPTGDS